MHTNTVHICTSIHPVLQLLLICSSPWRGATKYEGNAPYFGKVDQQYNSHRRDIMVGADGGGDYQTRAVALKSWCTYLLPSANNLSNLHFAILLWQNKPKSLQSKTSSKNQNFDAKPHFRSCAPPLFPNWATLQALWHERLHFAIVWSYPKYTKGSNCEMANRKIDSHPFFVSLAIQHQTSCCNYNSYYPHPHHDNDHPPHDHRPHLRISLEFPWVRDASLVAGVGKTRVHKVELVWRAEQRQFHHLKTTYSGWAMPYLIWFNVWILPKNDSTQYLIQFLKRLVRRKISEDMF